MPFYYAINPGTLTTSASSGTATSHVRPVTVANQRPAVIMGMMVCPALGTNGQLQMMLLTPTTILGSGGSAFTPVPRDPGAPAAGLTAFINPASEAGLLNFLSVAANQTGAMGQWRAMKVDNGMWFTSNPIVAGSARSLSVTGSVPFDLTLEFLEGP